MAVPEESACGAEDIGSARDSKRRMMRLHIVRGSFSTAQEDEESHTMDEAVWSKMPEDILWEVVRLVPVARQFRWQSVSQKWRRVLTSAEFRKRVVATAAAMRQSEEEQRQEQPRVVACVDVIRLSGENSSSSSSSSEVQRKAVDIDLASFVPSWFWQSDSYSVVAAADGLVCISNDSELQLNRKRKRWEQWEPWTNQYCVLNPLTRTCTVLPKVPFQPQGWQLPPTASAVTIHTYDGAREWKVATYDLAAGGGTGGWVVTALVPEFYPLEPYVALTLCAGETFWLETEGGTVGVLAPGPAGAELVNAAGAQDLVEVIQVESPGLNYFWCHDLPCYCRRDAHCHELFENCMFLVAHQGDLFLVAQLQPWADTWCSVACCIWRLARDPMKWVMVAYLDVSRLERLTRLTGFNVWGYFPHDFHEKHFRLLCAYGVRELLCCHVQVYNYVNDSFCPFLLGFNFDTSNWELVHELEQRDGELVRQIEQCEGVLGLCRDANCKAVPMELRPDLFLS